MNRYEQQTKSSILSSIWDVELFDELALRYSKRELRKQMESEKSVADVLDTIGTFYDRDGNYSGLGKYRKFPIQATRGEATEIVERVRERNPSTMLEVGTHYGGSLYLWMRALESVEKVVSVDLQFAPTLRLFETVARESKEQLSLIQANANNPKTRERVVQKLGGEKLDFVYFDGDHSYEGIKKHFNTYRPVVSDGGVIVMNCVEDDDYEVKEFWQELEDDFDCEKVSGNKPGVSGLVYV